MAIIIKDDTANSVVLTIDNNGNLAFADGTPISALTLAGYGVIDSDGYIVHGFGSSAVIPASGCVHIPTNQGVTINTVPGITPLAVVDTTPGYTVYDTAQDPGNPDSPWYVTSYSGLGANHSVQPYVGNFLIWCNTIAVDTRLITPGSDVYDPNIAAGTDVGYRWI
jgi:hypothetical protein